MKKYSIILCRICQKEVPRERRRGHPALYCCENHRKLWRKEYRRIYWKKHYEKNKYYYAHSQQPIS